MLSVRRKYMGKKSVKLKRFLTNNPLCCFCGGDTEATTMDHIPPRSFFLDRKHPKGLEFPACKHCNNSTSGVEDAARLLSLIQGTVYNTKIRDDFLKRSDSYIKSLLINKIRFEDNGIKNGENHLLKLDELTQEKLIKLSLKITLALYYNITKGDIVEKHQPISLIFYTADRIENNVINLLQNWINTPDEIELKDPLIAEQFYYRYIQFEKQFGKSSGEGWDFSLTFHLHQGYICIAKIYESPSYLQDVDKIVRYATG